MATNTFQPPVLSESKQRIVQISAVSLTDKNLGNVLDTDLTHKSISDVGGNRAQEERSWRHLLQLQSIC
jgi:hypothetical protein